jgi:excisionase family DNA binding protein
MLMGSALSGASPEYQSHPFDPALENPYIFRFCSGSLMALDASLLHPEAFGVNKLLSVTEAADALALKPATIRAWLLRRKLPRVNCGRAVRIPADAIERFIRENTIPAKDQRS